MTIEVRVERKLKQMRSKFYKMGAEAKLVRRKWRRCARASQRRRTCLRFDENERSVRGRRGNLRCCARPDIAGDGRLEEQPASGFVAVGQLVGSVPGSSVPQAVAVNIGHAVAIQNEGMD